jgi:tripartite-type tricarboxylate transporter receptor subunit TctC
MLLGRLPSSNQELSMERKMKPIRNVLFASFLVVAAGAGSIPSLAASWPDRIVRIVVASAPGGSMDLAARLFAEQLTQRWGRPVVIDNRPGADGIIAVQALLQANDGHTLLLAFPGVVTVVPLLHERLPYDPVGDLVPISSIANDFLTVAVTPALSIGSLDELVKLAQTRPGRLNWAAAPGAPYLTFLEFQRHAGVELAYVPYRSAVLALPDLMTGQIQVVVTPLSSALALARDGKLKLLAVTTLQRQAAARELPTATEAGYPELTIEAPLGLFGPKGMPPDLRERVAADVQAVAVEPTIIKRLEAVGMVAKASKPAEYAATLDAQRARWAALARAYGVHPQK